MLNHLRWYFMVKWIKQFSSTPPFHLSHVSEIMRSIKEALREEFNEDNMANTYWIMRESLDEHFEYYLKTWKVNMKDQVPDDIEIYRMIKKSGLRKHGEIAKMIAGELKRKHDKGAR